MPTRYWQVDAFTETLFGGNPAAVFVLNAPTSNDHMQTIAAEVNLPISAFVCFVDRDQNELTCPSINFFTPTYFVPLCGHGTLACSHIYFTEINPTASQITYSTAECGSINVQRIGKAYQLQFPLLPISPLAIDTVPEEVNATLSGHRPSEAFRSAQHLLLVYEDDSAIYDMKDSHFGTIEEKTVIVTARARRDTRFDFVSRVFHLGLEDAVCGSAHCTTGNYSCYLHY